MINNGFDHFKYSVHIRFIRNTANPYSVYKKPNPNTANPYSVYKKTNPNSFISYSVYKKRNYSVPYIFGFGRIIRIRLIPIYTQVLFVLSNSCENIYTSDMPEISLGFVQDMIYIGVNRIRIIRPNPNI